MNRLHDHDGDIGLLQNVVKLLCAGAVPVVIVKLHLDEIPRIGVDELAQRLRTSVEGKAEIADLSLLFERVKILDCAACEDIIDKGILNAVEQIEVDAIHFQPSELLCKLLAIVRIGLEIELIGNIKAVARIFGQRGTEELFGSSAVIDVGGVVVVYAAFHGRVYDCLRLFVINIGAAAAGGQTHGAHSQPRKRDLVFEIFVLHANTPFI